MASYLPILRAIEEPICCVLLGEPLEVKLHFIKETGSFPCQGSACRFCPGRANFRFFYPAGRLRKEYCHPTAAQEADYKLRCRLGENALLPEGKHSWNFKGLGVAEIPDSKIEVIEEHDARALIIELSKQSSQRSAPIRVTIRGRWPDEAGNLPPAFDVAPYLERIWGMSLPKSDESQEKAPSILKFKTG